MALRLLADGSSGGSQEEGLDGRDCGEVGVVLEECFRQLFPDDLPQRGASQGSPLDMGVGAVQVDVVGFVGAGLSAVGEGDSGGWLVGIRRVFFDAEWVGGVDGLVPTRGAGIHSCSSRGSWVRCDGVPSGYRVIAGLLGSRPTLRRAVRILGLVVLNKSLSSLTGVPLSYIWRISRWTSSLSVVVSLMGVLVFGLAVGVE